MNFIEELFKKKTIQCAYRRSC